MTEDGLVLYGSRLVVPVSVRNDTLACLHDSHRGIEVTKRRARQLVWWPGINSDISNRVKGCTACQELLPSLPKEPLLSGKEYLIYRDRLSGWHCLPDYGRYITSRTTTRFLSRLFRDEGVPVRFRADGGPQFNSSPFQLFFKRWGIVHVMSSPGYPQCNTQKPTPRK